MSGADALAGGREALAVAMLTRGARSTYVAAATGLTPRRVARLYRGIHGRSPPSGQMPMHAAAVIRTRAAQAHASLFLTLYVRECGGAHRADPWTLVEVYDRYVALAPCAPIDITQAYLLAQDLRIGCLSLRRCTTHGIDWADMDGAGFAGCPLCSPALGGGAIRRRGGRVGAATGREAGRAAILADAR